MTDRTEYSAETLQHILADEVDGYRQLIEVTQREHTALKQNDLTALLLAVQDKEPIIAKLKQLERAREEAVADLVQALGISPNANLSDLINSLDETSADKLSILRNEFLSLVEQFHRLNHSNRLMLEVGLIRIDSTFEYLAKITSPKEGYYGVNGAPQISPQTAAGNVLNREA